MHTHNKTFSFNLKSQGRLIHVDMYKSLKGHGSSKEQAANALTTLTSKDILQERCLNFYLKKEVAVLFFLYDFFCVRVCVCVCVLYGRRNLNR